MAGPVLASTGQGLEARLNTIITEFKVLRDADGVMRRLATKYTLEPHSGTSKVVLNYGRVTAYVQQDGVDTANAQSLSDAASSYAPYEVAVQVILPGSTMRRVADPDLMRRTGRILENAYNLKEDQDLAAQLASFVPTKGAATTVLGVGHHTAAVTTLQVGNNRASPEPAPEPLFACYHPCQLHAILSRLVPLTDVPVGTNVWTAPGTAGATAGPGRSSALSDEILRKWKVKELGGVPIIPEPNIAVDSVDDASGGVFSQEGLIYISEVEPKLAQDKDGSMRDGVELTYWGAYGGGTYRASSYGCRMLFDAQIPTA